MHVLILGLVAILNYSNSSLEIKCSGCYENSSLILNNFMELNMKKSICFLISVMSFFFSLQETKSQWEKCNDSLANILMENYKISACGDKIFAYGSAYEPRLYMSVDNASHWIEKKLNYTSDIAANKFFEKDNYLLMGTGKIGILRSTDTGNTWTETTQEFTNLGIYEYANLGDKIFAACNMGILESIDSGKTWTQINDTLIKGINSIYINENIIYAVSTFSEKILVSSDSGNTWINIQSGIIKDLSVWVMRGNGKDIFINVFGGGFYFSSNGGESWEERMNGLPPLEKRNIYDFIVSGDNIILQINAISPKDKEQGIYISTDKGISWSQKNTGLGSTTISNLTYNSEYAFTYIISKGVYRAKLTDLFAPTGVDDIEIEYYTHHFFATSPRPTPTNNSARITLYWDSSFILEDAITGVCDSYGNIIEGKENMMINYLSSYKAELTWDCSSLTSGAYFIAVRHNGITDCIPVVVVK
jgi:photosystem II stability/assembly factor-like uncharacterized protein